MEGFLPVGADVEGDGQGPGRIDARRGGVQGELADGDGHAARALVAEAQDALVVGDHDQADRLVGRRAQDLVDAADVVGRDPDAARTPQDVAELLAGAADGRRVDDRQELLEVLGQDAVEERLVAVLQGRQADVALEVVRLAADVLELEGDLLLDGRDARRHEPAQAERVALVVGEGGALVEQRLGDQFAPTATGDEPGAWRFEHRSPFPVAEGASPSEPRSHTGPARPVSSLDGGPVEGRPARPGVTLGSSGAAPGWGRSSRPTASNGRCGEGSRATSSGHEPE